MTAALACMTCGAELRPSAKFCDACGSPTAVRGTPAEYKQVTLLFADVVHSMDIAAAVGAERLREIMTALVNRSATVVQRYGGTVDKFTGDGIMAAFGAPTALEDHAIRACLAALGIQQEAKQLAAEVEARDGIALQLRVGLNSGQVIAGEIGAGSLGYTVIGEQVGLAQRMESAAPPGGVMCSDSTARLVAGAAVLAAPEMVHIKGVDHRVPAWRLLGTAAEGRSGAQESALVGRQWEMDALAAMLDRAASGHGCVVVVVGPAGIGKSRIAGEIAAIAEGRGVRVVTTYCESHANAVPFHVVARLLQAMFGVADLDASAARERLRTQIDQADPEDLLLLDDVLGIADPDAAAPDIDPDARRRRLTALISAALLARTAPSLHVVEDAHWIDEVSESMLAEVLTVIRQTPSLVLVTTRPDYHGALTRIPGAQTIALAALSDSESAALTAELMGAHSSVTEIAAQITERAGGNPFFTEEIVRELAARGVLDGDRGAYVCPADAAELSVPPTLHAAIAARIDRLDPAAKRAVNAAAVAGSRFDADLLRRLGVDAPFDELIKAELIDQIRFTAPEEYAFSHPLIRTVAYESQLKSDRAELHRRVATAIEARDPESADENAALIAQHLEAAGDLRVAYGWHMRAGAWLTNRDIDSARRSWERARLAADSLPDDHADRTAMRIAPRTMLCATAFRVHENISGSRFEELRELCTATGDKASLVSGMAGLVMEHVLHARVREASVLASEYMALLESIGDPTLTVGLSFAAIVARCEAGQPVDMLRWSQTVIDLAGGDPMKGNLVGTSPLATALAWRGLARWWLGRAGWRGDFDQAVALARATDPMTHATVIAYKYGPAIPLGVLLPDDRALRDIAEALRGAERSGDDVALASVRLANGLALVHRDSPDRERGLEVLAQVRDMCLHEQFTLTEVAIADVYAAQETARRADPDDALRRLRAVLDELFDQRQSWCIPATGIFVETLLSRGSEGDVEHAERAVDRLAAAPTDAVWPPRDIMVLRLRALLARAHDDAPAYAHFRDRYRDMARTLEFDGHIAWAEAMT
jgi:class 3 adenylate cyclase